MNSVPQMESFWSRETPPATAAAYLGPDVMSLIMTNVIGHHAKINSKREYVIKEVDETYEIVRTALHPHFVRFKRTYDIALDENAIPFNVLKSALDELIKRSIVFSDKYDCAREYVQTSSDVLNESFVFDVVGGLQDAGNQVIGEIEELVFKLFSAYVEE